MNREELVARRKASGLTQQQLAVLSGVSQPNIAAYERGARRLTEQMAARLAGYLRVLPSAAVSTHRDEILRLAHQHRCSNVRVFGSVARGQDTYDSDVDLLVTPDAGATVFDLALLPEEVEKLLGMHVDVVSDGGLRADDAQILAEAVPL